MTFYSGVRQCVSYLGLAFFAFTVAICPAKAMRLDPGLVSYNIIPLQGTGFKLVVVNRNRIPVQVQFEVVCNYFFNGDRRMVMQHADHYFYAYPPAFGSAFAINACNQGYAPVTTATSFNVIMTKVFPGAGLPYDGR